MRIRQTCVGAVSEELAAEAQISAANRRAVMVRAEAALLVEAVEDRAHSVSLLFRHMRMHIISAHAMLVEAVEDRAHSVSLLFRHVCTHITPTHAMRCQTRLQ